MNVKIPFLRVFLRYLIFLLFLLFSNCEIFNELNNSQELRNSTNNITIRKEIVKIRNFNFNNATVTVVRLDMLVGWLDDKNLQNNDIIKQSIQTRNTERLEITMLKLGAKVTEREKVNKILSEIKFSMTGLTENQAIKIGKMLNSDYVVFGNISNYGYIDIGKTIGIDIGIKSVSVESGTIVFQALLSGRMKGIKDDTALEYDIYSTLFSGLKSLE
jgi:hypothetical protein